MPPSDRSFELNTYDPEYARLSARAPVANRPSNANDQGVRLTDLLQRRRKALIICFFAATCCAVVTTMWFRTSSWKHQMVTNYVPVANRSIGVASPEVSTLKSFLLAPEIEHAMRTEFPDYRFADEFDETFDVKIPYGTDTIEIELESSDDSHAQAFRSWVAQFVQVDTWRSPPRFVDDWKRRSAEADARYNAAVAQSERLLNHLREVFAEYVAERRQTLVKARLDDAQQTLDEWTEKLARDRAELAKFNREHRVRDLQAEASALMDAVTAWEERLEEARLAKTSTDQELAEVQRRLNALKKAAASTQETAEDLERLEDSPQRQIEREKRRLDFEKLRSEVARARKQFDYDKKLHEKRFISDAEFEQKQLALAALEEQLKGAEKIWNLELQIEEENIALGGAQIGRAHV